MNKNAIDFEVTEGRTLASGTGRSPTGIGTSRRPRFHFRLDLKRIQMKEGCFFAFDLGEGISAVRKAVELNPGAIILREWLVKKYAESGSPKLMNLELEMVERIRGSKVPSRIEDLQ